MNIRSLLDSLRNHITEAWGKLGKPSELAKKPDLEVNPPRDDGGWNNRKFLSYFLLFLALLYVWQSVNEVRQNEIPYSEFLSLVKEKKIDQAW